MKKKMIATESYAGLDWGDKEHAICVVDDQGKKICAFTAKHSVAGLDEIVGNLNKFTKLKGVAVETNRHIVVQALLDAGIVVYPINPKVSYAWRETWYASAPKCDGHDALVLADGLRMQHNRLHTLQPDTEEARAFAMLCRDESRLIKERSSLVQQLLAALKIYFPAAIEWCPDLVTQTAWDFILIFTTAENLAKASKQKIVGFLKKHRIKLTPEWEERIRCRSRVTDWPTDPAAVTSKSLLAISLAKQLRTLEAQLKEYRKRIKADFALQEDSYIFESLPGAGEKLAPRLKAHFGTNHERYDSAQPIKQLSGAAPVTFSSGNKKVVRIRRACQKPFRETLHQFAEQSIRQSEWARAYYNISRARNNSHAQALRALANKWLSIIYRMWQNNEVYNEARYVLQLVRKRSPIAYELKLL